MGTNEEEILLEQVFPRYLDHDFPMEQMYVENQWYYRLIHRLNTLQIESIPNEII